ncbi:ectoine utilization protein EutC [Oceanidesulfovibrio marinus]|uniref:Ornithine cyclodeaminase family protein n=1 Tax=Oceanidesulfovibrio marinus TaxID=370038 RepID=A0A6P1ZK05_9BACT|nr:ectoine utilization protein EutC [Oceanidesulfovibrio marinus]TVM35906.1 ornithine cyclodeaminase family protein [Oceanidesulfovibrio marinus]
MATIKILTEAELKSCVQLNPEAVACVEDAFRTLAGGGVVMPPILRLDIEENNGEVDVKTAYVPGLDSFAIKISPGFFDNPKIGLPSLNGLMTLFSAKTGLVEALLLDNGYLTAVRTAAAGAVAAKNLSREDSETVTVLGAGEQGRLQLEAISLVRPVKRARYWAPHIESAQKAAALMADRLNIEVTAQTDAQAAVTGADIVVTATPATSPILMADWLEPGQTAICMGSDAEHKNELEPAAIAKADAYVPDRLSQVRILGELHHAIDAGIVAPNADFAELGEVIAGMKTGRASDLDIVIADLTGTGLQDTAIATFAFQRAMASGCGADFES